MLHNRARLPDHIRLVRRISPQTTIPVQLRCVRPSLANCGRNGDACLEDRGDGTLALWMGEHHCARITGLPLDLPSLNQLLDRVGHQRPRCRR